MPEDQRINLKTLPEDQRLRLIGIVYPVFIQLFSHWSRDKFIQEYIDNPDAVKAEINLYHNAEGTLIGFFIIQVFQLTITSKKVYIIRGEAGILPAWREHKKINLLPSICSFYLRRLLLAHIVYPIYYADIIISPKYYASLNSRFIVYPSMGKPLPPDKKALLSAIATFFSYKIVDKDHWVATTHDEVIYSQEEKEKLKASTHPGIIHFLNCAGFSDKGMLIAIDFSFSQVLVIIGLFIKTLIRRLF